MPHVIVKLTTGRTDEQKARLSEGITKAVMAGAGVRDEVVTISFEDIAPEDWVKAVYEPDIIGKPETLYKKPGYDPR